MAKHVSAKPGQKIQDFHQNLLDSLRAINAGDPTVRITSGQGGVMDEIVAELNRLIAKNQYFGRELARPEAEISPTYRSKGLENRKILIVDDNQYELFAFTGFLESQGAEVLIAESGPEGLEIIKTTPGIDLVLMSALMSGMDGYQVTREIRKIPGFGALPVIALTASATTEDRAQTIESGCSDFIPKPIENETLLSVVERWIERE